MSNIVNLSGDPIVSEEPVKPQFYGFKLDKNKTTGAQVLQVIYRKDGELLYSGVKMKKGMMLEDAVNALGGIAYTLNEVVKTSSEEDQEHKAVVDDGNRA